MPEDGRASPGGSGSSFEHQRGAPPHFDAQAQYPAYARLPPISLSQVPTLTQSLYANAGLPAASSAPSPTQVKVPRPPNAWILYRSFKIKELKDLREKSGAKAPPQAELSKAIAEMWKAEPQDIKTKFEEEALKQRTAHAEQYPGIRYGGRKSRRVESPPLPSTHGRDPYANALNQPPRRASLAGPLRSPSTQNAHHPYARASASEWQPPSSAPPVAFRHEASYNGYWPPSHPHQVPVFEPPQQPYRSSPFPTPSTNTSVTPEQGTSVENNWPEYFDRDSFGYQAASTLAPPSTSAPWGYHTNGWHPAENSARTNGEPYGTLAPNVTYRHSPVPVHLVPQSSIPPHATQHQSPSPHHTPLHSPLPPHATTHAPPGFFSQIPPSMAHFYAAPHHVDASWTSQAIQTPLYTSATPDSAFYRENSNSTYPPTPP